MLRCLGVFPLVRLGLLGVLAGTAFLIALERPAPLFLNLGPGDEPHARGFRDGWERDGLQGSGETLFRWSEDGARLELPVVLTGAQDAQARLRIARFLDTPAEIRLLSGVGEVDRWTQEPRGWTVRRVDLRGLSGPLRLQLRSSAADPRDPLGVAVDWVEIRGVGRILPRAVLLPGLLALFLGVPLVVAWGLGRTAAAAGLVLLLFAAALAVGLDRLGGLIALSQAGFPALVCCGFVLAASRLLLSPAARSPRGASLAVCCVALIALSHPGYYYPDVDTHARYLQAIRRDPALALDPAAYQARTGAWTREIAGRKVAFPYSPAFHLLASPLALVLGDVAAVKTLAVMALGVSLLLVELLASAAGLSPPGALLATVLLALLPVTASRLALALYPTLLGQAVELAVVVALATRERMRPAPLLVLLVVAQAAYTASLFNVAAFVGASALLLASAGRREEAAHLLGAWALAALLVVAILYGRFLPTLVRDVIPHMAAGSDGPETPEGPVLVSAGRRLALFYDALYPILVALGLVALQGAPVQARRALHGVLLGGLGLLLLRYLLPTIFRDAKEIEMLAPAVAVSSALGLVWLAERGAVCRALAVLCGTGALAWGLQRAAASYAERFVAVAR
jgi:hypothetical protein